MIIPLKRGVIIRVLFIIVISIPRQKRKTRKPQDQIFQQVIIEVDVFLRSQECLKYLNLKSKKVKAQRHEQKN